MSPTVRDGRRQRTEYAVELAAIGTGPIERRQADTHERAGFAPGRPSPGLPAVVARRVPIADVIHDNETPVAPLIRLADPPVTTVTPEEHVMAIEPPPEIPVESPSHLEQDPPPPVLADSRLNALRAVVVAVDELVAATEAYHAAGARLAAAEQAVEEAWGRAPWRPKGWTNIPEIIPEPAARERVPVDEDVALAYDRQAALEDAVVAAALRDDRLGDDPADDAPAIVARRPDAPTELAGEPGRTAAETRRAAVAAGGGPGPKGGTKQARILSIVVKHGGDLRAIASELGTTRDNVNATLHNAGKRGLLTIAMRDVLPASFAKYTGI